MKVGAFDPNQINVQNMLASCSLIFTAQQVKDDLAKKLGNSSTQTQQNTQQNVTTIVEQKTLDELLEFSYGFNFMIGFFDLLSAYLTSKVKGQEFEAEYLSSDYFLSYTDQCSDGLDSIIEKIKQDNISNKSATRLCYLLYGLIRDNIISLYDVVDKIIDNYEDDDVNYKQILTHMLEDDTLLTNIKANKETIIQNLTNQIVTFLNNALSSIIQTGCQLDTNDLIKIKNEDTIFNLDHINECNDFDEFKNSNIDPLISTMTSYLYNNMIVTPDLNKKLNDVTIKVSEMPTILVLLVSKYL